MHVWFLYFDIVQTNQWVDGNIVQLCIFAHHLMVHLAFCWNIHHNVIEYLSMAA